MNITAAGLMHFKALNESIRRSPDREIVIDNCIGQRYIGDGLDEKRVIINGTPGNALGAYLNGAEIILNGNAQDATGDTMNKGKICIHGSSGDATGYAMRGGKIFVKGDAGYRAGIHMKEFKHKIPALIIGGEAGSFLGEYQAGGYIVVLGLNSGGKPPVGNFCGNGMHGGKIFLRACEAPKGLPPQVEVKKADNGDLTEIDEYLTEFCRDFEFEKSEILKSDFYVLTANSKNPYKQLYTYN